MRARYVRASFDVVGTCKIRANVGWWSRCMHDMEGNAQRYEAMRQAEGRVDVARISPKAEGGLLGDAPAVGGGRGVAAVTTSWH